MAYIKDIPALKGNNYTEWKKKIDLAFILAEVDWVISTPFPTEPVEPMRGADETDAAWATKEVCKCRMPFDLQKRQWATANKKCLAVVKNTIDPTIVGSIGECDTIAEYLEKIKSQFHSSSKTYTTQLIKQLMTERYSGHGNGNCIREHISKMNHLNNKLKPMDLELKEEFLVHVIFSSLLKEFDTFVVNYNIQPEKWNLERCIVVCVQEEERIKAANGGTLNFVRDNKRKNVNANVSSPSKAKGKSPMHQQPQQKKGPTSSREQRSMSLLPQRCAFQARLP